MQECMLRIHQLKTMTLRILATGGTFDKHYDEIAGKLGFSLQRTVMPGSTGLSRAHDVEIYRLLAEEYFERGYAQ